MKIKDNSYLKILLTVFLIFLIINAVLLSRMLGFIYLPGEISQLDKAKEGARAVVRYSSELAESYGIRDRKNIVNLFAEFEYEIEKAESDDVVASIMMDYGRQIQDEIFREVQQMRINEVLHIINSQQLPEKGVVSISHADGKIKIIDPDDILEDKTKDRLQKIDLFQTLELKIEDQKAEVTAGDIFNLVEYLKSENVSLKRQYNILSSQSGYSNISGQGIVIYLQDDESSADQNSLIHDSDIRNIINELWIAGARGLEVGGQRINVKSSVRCVGPTILVNSKPIAVNPVVIRAVGNPDVLHSSLDIIKKKLNSFGIEVSINEEENITLNSSQR
ncbi:MAG: DUF881 domain-containing protein [Bacillota bacterium]